MPEETINIQTLRIDADKAKAVKGVLFGAFMKASRNKRGATIVGALDVLDDMVYEFRAGDSIVARANAMGRLAQYINGWAP